MAMTKDFKLHVLSMMNSKPATAEVICWRLGLIVNRVNMHSVRAAAIELRGEGKITSYVIGSSQEVAYYD